MQVLWNQQFIDDFPVEFYISECIVSDADNEFSVVESGCRRGGTVDRGVFTRQDPI